MPLMMSSVKATKPSLVAGTLIITLGRLMAACKRLASAMVPVASRDNSGDTSKLTKPVLPPDWSNSGRHTSQAA